MRDLYALHATTPDGISVLTEPMGIVEAMRITDEHLAPHGWLHRYEPLTPVAEAVQIFGRGRRKPHPIEEADFFVALRRAILADPAYDGIESYYVQGLLAHVDPHRPMQLYRADEEHLLGECGCPRDEVGVCAEMEPADRICTACTAIIDSNTEFGPHFGPSVMWPCPVISSAAEQYGVQIGPVPA
jgi:hypothetical protein